MKNMIVVVSSYKDFKTLGLWLENLTHDVQTMKQAF
jgi:hypothetical protein